MKLWSYLRQIISGLVTYIVLIWAMDSAMGMILALSHRPISHRDVLHSLLFLLGFAALAALTCFLYKKLFRGARLAWWTATICNLLMLPAAVQISWFAIHYPSGNVDLWLALTMGFFILLYFAVLSLSVTRRYCGVSNA